MSIELFNSKNSLEFLIIRHNKGPLLFQEVEYPLSSDQDQPFMRNLPLYNNPNKEVYSDYWWVILTNKYKERRKIKMRLIRETCEINQVTLFTHYVFEEPESSMSQIEAFYNIN